MKTTKQCSLLAAMVFGSVVAVFGQLQWNSYNNVGTLVGSNIATGGDSTYGGSVSFTVPATTELVFMTETFVPTNLASSGASAKINFTFSASGGLYPGDSGR